jgi:hypothetical protein
LPEKKEKTKVSLSQLKISIMMFDMPAMFPWMVSAAELGASVESILKFQRNSLEPSIWKVMERERFSGGGTPAF